jgi:DMSO/TMAO reductase YedYZ molybdopterin-dependent catalytic subunit
MSQISRDFRGHRREIDTAHLPPGQHVVDNFPVLSGRSARQTPLDEWTFRISGASDQPVLSTWKELLALPAETPVVDIHRVTKWSKLATMWKGMSVDVLLDAADTDAKYVSAWCDGGYTTNLPFADLTGGRAGIAYESAASRCSPNAGGLRLVVSHLYSRKSDKRVRGPELLDHDNPALGKRSASTTTVTHRESRAPSASTSTAG